MMPGGHLATSLALAGVAYVTTGSVETAAGCVAGGFLIDVDHYLDYLVFERQWRRPSPISFLRYYFSSSPRRFVLPLHSAEFMTFLFGLILAHPWPLLVGYWVGAFMHLTFDVLVNGDIGLKKPVLFYFFAYRARYRFAAKHLVRTNASLQPSRRPVRDFFRWRPVEDRPSESTLVQSSSQNHANQY
jgi:uncharacterized membrane protein